MGLIEMPPAAAATCHPSEPVFFRAPRLGLCTRCYYRDYRAYLKDGTPRKSYNVMPEPEPVLPPALELEVVRRSAVFTEWPQRCPHCHGQHTLEFHGREAHCAGELAGCGWSGYLVRILDTSALQYAH